MVIQSWIMVGLVAGWLVGMMLGRGSGIAGDIILGIIGGPGGWLSRFDSVRRLGRGQRSQRHRRHYRIHLCGDPAYDETRGCSSSNTLAIE